MEANEVKITEEKYLRLLGINEAYYANFRQLLINFVQAWLRNKKITWFDVLENEGLQKEFLNYYKKKIKNMNWPEINITNGHRLRFYKDGREQFLYFRA
jgi:hypothetical protein